MVTPAHIHCRLLSRGLANITIRATSSVTKPQPNYRRTVTYTNACGRLHTTAGCSGLFSKKKRPSEAEKEETRIAVKSTAFVGLKKKTKGSFIDIVETFLDNNPNRRGHVEFIYACLRNMEDFGVEKDLNVYKKLLNVFPKEKMVPKNELQTEFMHFPWHQQCAIDVLCQMEDNGVIPDKEVQITLLEAFGYRSHPIRKFARMLYWMSKFKHASPFPLPNPVPNDTLELAMLAIRRITSVDLQTKVDIYNAVDLEDAVDHTWLISAQSPKQKELLDRQPKNKPLHVDGAFRVWLRNTSIAYFILRAENTSSFYSMRDTSLDDDVSNIKPWLFEEEGIVERASVHEQEDGTILATCATGTSSRDSLLSWIRFLQHTNPSLKTVPVIFSLKAPSTAIVPVNVAGLDEKEIVVGDVPK